MMLQRKGIALIQPSSAFMERVFFIMCACMDERQESSFSDRIAASALLMYVLYKRGRGKQHCIVRSAGVLGSPLCLASSLALFLLSSFEYMYS